MAGPFYRITIHTPAEVTARHGRLLSKSKSLSSRRAWRQQLGHLARCAEPFRRVDPSRTDHRDQHQSALRYGRQAAQGNGSLIVASDVRLLALRDADAAARLAINWLNLKTGPILGRSEDVDAWLTSSSAQFTASKLGVDALTVVWNVERLTLSDGTRSALVTGGATDVAIGRNGLYGYRLTGADLALIYMWQLPLPRRRPLTRRRYRLSAWSCRMR